MREWHVRHGLDCIHVEDPQIGLPLVKPIQGIMVRAEVLGRGLASSRSIEHAAQSHDAAMYAKAHDAACALVHHDEHPVCAQNGRFASKQIETPQTVLRMTDDRQPGRPESGSGRYRTTRMRRTTSFVMEMAKAKAIC